MNVEAVLEQKVTKQKQLQWEKEHLEQLEEYLQAVKRGQKIRLSSQIEYSVHFKIFLMREAKCQACCKGKNFKVIKTKTYVGFQLRNTEKFLLLCEGCFEQRIAQKSLQRQNFTCLLDVFEKMSILEQKQIDGRQKYYRIHNLLSSLHQKKQQLLQYCKKAISVCFQNLENDLKDYAEQQFSFKIEEIVAAFVLDSACGCKLGCCQCNLEKNQNFNNQCDLKQDVKKREAFVRKLELLPAAQTFSSVNYKNVFDMLSQQVSQCFITNFGQLQKAFNKLQRQSQKLNLTNQSLLERIKQSGPLFSTAERNTNIKTQFNDSDEQIDKNWNCFSKFEYATSKEHLPLVPEEKDPSIFKISACDLQIKNEKEEYFQNCKAIDRNKSKIQSLQFDNYDQKTRQISSSLYQLLYQIPCLRSLYFSKIHFEEQSFIKLLQTNSANLRCLCLQQCQNMSNQCYLSISKLTSLTKCCLISPELFSFEGQLPHLDTFVLERCYSDDLGNMVRSLLRKTVLTTLNLYQCRFIDVQKIQEILQDQLENGKKLISINLGYTKITNQTLETLNKFPLLKDLNIGGNDVDLQEMLFSLERGELQNLRKIRRLTLKDMNLNSEKVGQDFEGVSQYLNMLFRRILFYFPLLTHLDISLNRNIDENSVILGLKKLVELNVKDTIEKAKKGPCKHVTAMSKTRLKFRQNSSQEDASPTQTDIKNVLRIIY